MYINLRILQLAIHFFPECIGFNTEKVLKNTGVRVIKPSIKTAITQERKKMKRSQLIIASESFGIAFKAPFSSD